MIKKTVLLPGQPSRAFALFTTRISDWWPPERRLVLAALARAAE